MEEIVDGTVCAFHLSNGQTVIAKIEKQDDFGFHVVKPMELLIAPSQAGVSAGFVPFLSMMGVFDTIESMILPYEDVLYPRPAPSKLEQKYREDTGMIVTPDKSLVIVK